MRLVRYMKLINFVFNWLNRHKDSHVIIYDYVGNGHEVYISWNRTDHRYIAEVPDLPGCMADAATEQEVIANSVCVVNEWIDAAKSMERDIP